MKARIKNKLLKINGLLINEFGTPAKAAVPPDPLDLLIATILSQNTNDKNSFRAYQTLKINFASWDEVSSAPQKKLEDAIKIAGLTSQKASSIKNLLNYLKEQKGSISLQYLSKLSDDQVLSELRKIKGIGLKTISCVLLFSFGRNVCPVDTHVHRTLNRIGVVKTSSPDKTFKEIRKYLPEGAAHQIHTNLIRLGREICKPAVPVCHLCPLKKICSFPAKDFERKTRYSGNNFFLLDSI